MDKAEAGNEHDDDDFGDVGNIHPGAVGDVELLDDGVQQGVDDAVEEIDDEIGYEDREKDQNAGHQPALNVTHRPGDPAPRCATGPEDSVVQVGSPVALG